jgi:hypothetical protein
LNRRNGTTEKDRRHEAPKARGGDVADERRQMGGLSVYRLEFVVEDIQ